MIGITEIRRSLGPSIVRDTSMERILCDLSQKTVQAKKWKFPAPEPSEEILYDRAGRMAVSLLNENERIHVNAKGSEIPIIREIFSDEAGSPCLDVEPSWG